MAKKVRRQVLTISKIQDSIKSYICDIDATDHNS